MYSKKLLDDVCIHLIKIAFFIFTTHVKSATSYCVENMINISHDDFYLDENESGKILKTCKYTKR